MGEWSRPPITVLLMAASLGVVAVAHAQQRPATPSPSSPPSPDSTGRCHGETVSAIDIQAEPPVFGPAAGAWRILQNLAGLQHPSTHPEVVASFLSLEVGEPCTEFRRTESERVLRRQPFLASARVRARPDGPGRVRIEVATTDEVPVIIGARVNGTSPEALRLGDANVNGTGISVAINGERGHAYRDAFGARIVDYAVFQRPWVLSLDLQRRTLGHLVAVDFSRPFYTDLQRLAWHTNYRDDDDFLGLARPAGDPLALNVRQRRWEAGAVLRQRIFGEVGVVGLLASGVDVDPASQGVIVSDSGLLSDTGVVLRDRYTAFRATRPAALLGLRVVRFTTVQGFNTLDALEDLPSGVQFGGLVGRGLPAAGASDLFLSGSLYAGRATEGSFIGLQVEMEARRDYELARWDDFITSTRLAWYRKQSLDKTLVVSNELSGGSRPRLPLQLTFGSLSGGLRGYRGSTLAGAWRNVLRVEQRWLLASGFHDTDLGLAGFVDVGTLFAGSAPYGSTTPIRASVGVSFLGAFPSHSKRLLRIDLAVPTTHDGNDRWEVRFSIDDLTRRFWREPGDVTRARTGPVPSSLFTWPTR
jgi:hypothetical protein